MIEIDWRGKAEKLWSLLDDIDTASDAFKPNDEKSYKKFFNYAMKKCAERGKYMNSLDGHTLTAVEEEEYNNQLEKMQKLLFEFDEENNAKIMDLINSKAGILPESDKHNFYFKWNHLVSQEIIMWMQINKKVTDDELNLMCSVRGFDDDMKEYLDKALKHIGLR